MADTSVLQQLPTDAISVQLLPTEWRYVTPLTCYGDRNCLYRYATCKHKRCQIMYIQVQIQHPCNASVCIPTQLLAVQI